MSIYRMVEGTWILLVLSSALALTACDTGLKHTSGIDSLILELYANHSQARVGEPIQIRFTTSNRGRNHIISESSDTPVIDIVVTPIDSDTVFLTWSDQNPEKITHRLEWAPGESKTIELTWTPKQEEIWYGAPRYVRLSGRLYSNSNSVPSAGVTVCASNACP